MLGIGFGEFILIAGIALVVMGPEKFPEIAKIAIRFVGEFRTHWDDIKREVTSELRPLNKELKQLSRYDPEDYLKSLTPKDEAAKAAKQKPADGEAPAPEPGGDPLENKDGGDFGPDDPEHYEPYPYSGHIVKENMKAQSEGDTAPADGDQPVTEASPTGPDAAPADADNGGYIEEDQDSVTDKKEEDAFDVPEVRRLD